MNGGPRWTAVALRLRPPPVAIAILFAALAGGALVLVSGHDPLQAYAETVKGSLSRDSLPDTMPRRSARPGQGGEAGRLCGKSRAS